jgi:hypothetical protein
MKKLITSIILATTLGFVQPSMANGPYTTAQYALGYHNGYHNGYDEGKDSAYRHVARTAVIIGAVVIAGVIIYQIGKESRWTANEKGVVYRF